MLIARSRASGSSRPPQISGPVRLQAPEGRRAGAEERGDVSGDGEVSRRLVQRHLAANGRLRRLSGKLRDPRVQVGELANDSRPAGARIASAVFRAHPKP